MDYLFSPEKVLERLYLRHGVDLRGYRLKTLHRRLLRRLSATGCRTFREYLDLLEGEPAECERLVASLTIKASRFFRDARVFDLLAQEVLPHLAREKAARGEPYLSAWCAGCAQGQEAYSLAILLDRLRLGGCHPGLKIYVVATDIDSAALDFAREGIYLEEMLEEVEGTLREAYFHHEGSRYLIDARLRAMVVFEYHDLTGCHNGGPAEGLFASYDLILCRNVLMYYTREVQERVLLRLVNMLNLPGYLVLGRAEALPPGLLNRAGEIRPGTKIYCRRC
ncbi:MAG: protein-glutamate O-methyltransferase CheR [Bacillota bacterium]